MSSFIRLVVGILAVLSLTGCGGPVLVEPTVTRSDINDARRALLSHHLEPSRDLKQTEMWGTLMHVWNRLRYPIRQTCEHLYSSALGISPYVTGCASPVDRMQVELIRDDSVNAYADFSTLTIGVHTGLMRSAGSDDEIAWVLAHEAAHLLFGHGMKRAMNTGGASLVGAAAGIALGSALYVPGMDGEYIGDLTMAGMGIGRDIGYLAYSHEMELEADQFAAYVMKQDGRRLDAALDIIVRLHRGDVPEPVRRGNAWAGYLNTHPANDYRLASMQSTIRDIRSGVTRPLLKQEASQ